MEQLLFSDVLVSNNKDWILSDPNPEFPSFLNEEKVLSYLQHVVENDLRVLVYGDYDVDGACSRDISKLNFQHLGCTNFEVFPYFRRTHQVDPSALNRALSGRFDCMLICDAGSSDPLSLKRLKSQGVEIVLLDHHESVFGYSDFDGIHMINTSFDNRVNDKEITLSAGALTYIIFSKLCQRMGRPELKSTSALALASLYGDSIDMSGDLQRSIYKKATSLTPTELPVLLQRFIHSPDPVTRTFSRTASQFTRKYLEFTVNPRINGLFRSENFTLLNKLLDWKPGSSDTISDLVFDTVESHSKIRHELAKASDIMYKEQLSTMVIGNLSSVANKLDIPREILSNYTGVVANDLCTKYGKMAVVTADTGINIKGSVRDQMGRDYLPLFQSFCDANGHPSAFGLHLSWLQFDEFIRYLRLLDTHKILGSAENKPWILPHNIPHPDPDMLVQMSMYNEFSGNKLPKAYISKTWFSPEKPIPNKYGLLYKWGDFTVSTKGRSGFRMGSNLVLQPSKGYKSRTNRGVSLDLVKVGV